MIGFACARHVRRATCDVTTSPVNVPARIGNGETLVPDDNIDGALAVLSPDGHTLAYAGTRNGVRQLYLRPFGTLESTALAGTAGAAGHFFSPDGRWIGFFAGTSLKKISVTGGAAVTITEVIDARGATWGFSPDQQWIAYQSNESGVDELHVRPFPGPGGKYQASVQGGSLPRWTKGGRELVYLAGIDPTRFMAVDVTADGDALKIGKPRVLFEAALVRPSNGSWYDVADDGNRFVLLQPEAKTTVAGFTHVNLIFNSFTEIRRALSPK